jgi:hypothetical protein
MSTHTPGPWTSEVDDETGDCFKLKADDGTVLIGGCGCCGSPWMNGPYEANARLIAAAPDLLAVCERVFHLLRVSDFSLNPILYEFKMSEIEDLLDKVRGRS